MISKWFSTRFSIWFSKKFFIWLSNIIPPSLAQTISTINQIMPAGNCHGHISLQRTVRDSCRSISNCMGLGVIKHPWNISLLMVAPCLTQKQNCFPVSLQKTTRKTSSLGWFGVTPISTHHDHLDISRAVVMLTNESQPTLLVIARPPLKRKPRLHNHSKDLGVYWILLLAFQYNEKRKSAVCWALQSLYTSSCHIPICSFQLGPCQPPFQQLHFESVVTNQLWLGPYSISKAAYPHWITGKHS